VLILVAIVTFVTDVVIATSKDYTTFILIVSTVIISAMISFVQEAKSDKAAKKLQQMISNKIDVIRDDIPYIVDVSKVVPGDIVKLSSGDMIPGDVRFLITKDLFIDQASLTGESNPVEKFSENKKNCEVTSLNNIGFMGTNVVSGSATAVVLATGNDTYFGNMAKSLYSVVDKNSFERGVDSISKLLIKFMVVMVPIILIMNLLTKGDAWDSIIFAITIAVGLTPEMLPVMMTVALAKGAVEMSKKKTIVKRLRKYSNVWRNEYTLY
jgi:Mg2+-importing ATPase